jgi:hypothetical protein
MLFRPEADPPTEDAADAGGPSEVGFHAQRAVAWRSGGPNVASSQNGSRWNRNGEAVSHAYPRPMSCVTPSWRCGSTLALASKEVSVRAGHSSVAFTLDHYGHLYEDRSDALADQLDALLSESSSDRAAHMLHAE